MAGMCAGGGGGALQQQLGLIMAALTKAAVAEICAVVEEGYAALQLEITRSHRENQALKKKLHLIESIVVRGGGDGGGGEAGGDTAAAEVALKPEEAPQQQRRDGDGGAAAAAVVLLRDEFPEVVLIKDEDSDCEDSFTDDPQSAGDGGEAALGGSARSAPPGRGMKRNRSEDVGRRSSSELLAPKTPQPPSPAVYALDSPGGGGGEPGCSAHLGGAEPEAGDSLCSFSSQGDPDVQLVHRECPPISGQSNRHGYFVASPSGRAESDLNLAWTKASKSLVPFPPFPANGEDSDAFGLKLVSVSGSASSDCQFSESNDSSFAYADMMNFPVFREQAAQGGGGGAARGKRYVCAVCSKTYATAQNLEVHMRIHTGEKPFSCGQCGKKFTQSAHLKSHLSVHSGERPFSCAVCARSFIIKYSLKLHMKKCHPHLESSDS